MQSKHNVICKQSSATYFGFKSHLQAMHIIIIGNINYSAMNVIVDISPYIKTRGYCKIQYTLKWGLNILLNL